MSVLTDIFGSRPTVPAWTSLNLGTEQSKALTENIAAAPKASALANLTEQQLLSMMRTTFPNFDQVSQTVSANTLSELQGNIPKDVQDAIQRSTSATSLTAGTSGSEFSRNLLARDLGLTSLDLTQKGLASAESWMKASEQLLAPAAQVYTGMFITPGQQSAFDVNERNLQFQHDWLQNQVNAMPDPTTVGLWNTSWSIVDSVLSAYTGGNFSNMGKVSPQGAQYPGMGGFGGGGGGVGSDFSSGGNLGFGGWGSSQGQSINIYNDAGTSGSNFMDNSSYTDVPAPGY